MDKIDNPEGNEGLTKKLKELIKFDKDDAEAHNNFGELLRMFGRYKEAEKEFREAIRIRPDFVEAHFNLGLLLHRLKRYEEAEKEYREAIKLKPDLDKAHCGLGLLLKDLNLKEEAEKEFDEVRKLSSDDADVHINLNVVLSKLGRYEEAEKEFMEVIRLKGLFLPKYGVAIKEQDWFEEIEKKYKEAIGFNPDGALAHYLLAWLYATLNRRKESLEHLRTAIDLNPYLKDFAKKDPVFENLRNNMEFKKLVE